MRTYQRLLVSRPDSLNLLLQAGKVAVGSAQFAPEVVTAGDGRGTIAIASLVVALLLTVLRAAVRLLLCVRVVAAYRRRDGLLRVRVGRARLADDGVRWGRVGWLRCVSVGQLWRQSEW